MFYNEVSWNDGIMKWKEFLEKAKNAGVKEEDSIWFIDIISDGGITFGKDDDLGWCIT